MRLPVLSLVMTAAFSFYVMDLDAQQPTVVTITTRPSQSSPDMRHGPAIIQVNATQPELPPVTAHMVPVTGQTPNDYPAMSTPAEQTSQRPSFSVNNVLQSPNARLQQQLEEADRDLMKSAASEQRAEMDKKITCYHQAFDALNRMNPDSFSVTTAVFTVENAFLENRFPYESFMGALRRRADLIKQILRRENLDTLYNLALNYGIQKLYEQPNEYCDPITKKVVTIPPMGYDFDDFRGERDYTKMFTTKLLGIGTGQCHSLPLLYLMIAEQLGAKAWLSLAPQHSFIKFIDSGGHLTNFETTNGYLVSSNWLLQSGYITAAALKSRSYLDTLSQHQLYAQCMADLLLGYLAKFGNDDFAEQVRDRIAEINPSNMTAMIVNAEMKRQIAWREILAAGKPPVGDLPRYPQAYKAYQAMQIAYDQVDALGYQDMPAEAYQRWLQSLERERQGQESKALEQNMQRGLEALRKKNGVTVNNTIQ